MLQKKSFIYFNNKSPNQLIERQFYLRETLNFFNSHIPNLIISCIVAIIFGALIGINQLEFLYIALGQIVVNAAIFVYEFFVTKNITKKEIPQMEFQNKVSLQLDSNLRDEQNIKRFNFLMTQFRKSLIKNQNTSQQKATVNLVIENTKTFFQQGFDLAFLAFGVIGIIEQRFELGFLFYIFGIQALFSSYASRIVQFGASVNVYLFCREKLINLFDQKLNIEEPTVSWKCPKTITFENVSINLNQNLDLQNLNFKLQNETLICGANGSGKSSLLKVLTGRGFEYKGKIKLAGVDLKRYIKPQLFENIFYLNGQLIAQTEAPDFSYSETLFNNNNPLIYQLLSDAGINTQSKLSSGQRQILQLFLLGNLSGKVILLDETMNAISLELKPRVYELLIKPLTLHNFVLVVEHDLSFANKTQFRVNLNSFLQAS